MTNANDKSNWVQPIFYDHGYYPESGNFKATNGGTKFDPEVGPVESDYTSRAAGTEFWGHHWFAKKGIDLNKKVTSDGTDYVTGTHYQASYNVTRKENAKETGLTGRKEKMHFHHVEAADKIVGNDLGQVINGFGDINFYRRDGKSDGIDYFHSDRIFSGGGDDSVYGWSGHDVISLGSGNDLGDGGTGNDSMFGGLGNDTLDGGAGADLMYGGSGKDILKGGLGADTIYGGAGDDVIYSGKLEDRGDKATQPLKDIPHDVLSGGDGFDTFVIGDGAPVTPTPQDPQGQDSSSGNVLNGVDIGLMVATGIGGMLAGPAGAVAVASVRGFLKMGTMIFGKTGDVRNPETQKLDGTLEHVKVMDFNPLEDTIVIPVELTNNLHGLTYDVSGSEGLLIKKGDVVIAEINFLDIADYTKAGIDTSGLLRAIKETMVNNAVEIHSNQIKYGGGLKDATSSKMNVITKQHLVDLGIGDEYPAVPAGYALLVLGTKTGINTNFGDTSADNKDLVVGTNKNDVLTGYAQENAVREFMGTRDGDDYVVKDKDGKIVEYEVSMKGVGSGQDIIRGFGGDDTMAGGDGINFMYGGDGSDVVDYFHSLEAVTIDLRDSARTNIRQGDLTSALATKGIGRYSDDGSGTDPATDFSTDWLFDVEGILGTRHNDSLRGHETKAGLLDGRGGNDVLIGSAGDDSLITGTGNDTVTGGDGADHFWISGGANTIEDFNFFDGDILVFDMRAYEGTGFHDIWGKVESDGSITYTDVADPKKTVMATLTKVEGTNYVPFAVVDDTGKYTEHYRTSGTKTSDKLAGTANNDVLFGLSGNDTVNGSGGDDWIFGNAGNDRLFGDAGHDILYSQEGNDTLTGGQGHDTFIMRGGSATITDFDAMEGDTIKIDLAHYSATGRHDIGAGWLDGKVKIWDVSNSNAIIAEVQPGEGANRWTPFTLIDDKGVETEFFRTSGDAGDNVLTADATTTALFGGDLIYGGIAGNDELLGGSGNDTLLGGSGNDTIKGGTGYDTLDYSGAQGSVIVDLEDYSQYGRKPAYFDGNYKSTFLVNENGTKYRDTVEVSSIEAIKGSDFNDVLSNGWYAKDLYGGAGNDNMYGSNHAESLEGGSGNDLLMGLGGADVLHGGSGNDTLIGGSGPDLMTGGTGADEFQFGPGFQQAHITDFVVHEDTVRLVDGLSWASVRAIDHDTNEFIANDGSMLILDYTFG